MTNPGDSDEWWKQYGGEGVSPDAQSSGSAPQQSAPPPPGYSSAPNLSKQPETPSASPYPSYPPPQQNSAPSYPQPAAGSYQSGPNPYAQPAGGAYQSGPNPYPQTPGYGYQQPGYQPYGYGQPAALGTNGMAIAAMILSICGLLLCMFGVLSLAGLILGVVALNQIKQTGQQGRGMALAGIWVGAGGLALAVIYWVFIIVAAMSGSA